MTEEETITTETRPVKSETSVDSADIELQIKEAMKSRVNLFKEQSDSLTFEGVRRLLEKDLGLEEYALDVRKRFVKQCLLQYLDGAREDNASKDSGEATTEEKTKESVKREVADLESAEGQDELKNDTKEPCSENEEKMEDSPVMGLLTGKKATAKVETKQASVDKNDNKAPTESTIKKAMLKRAAYVKANINEVTMGALRRLLEEDLGLEKFALDPFKKFISSHLDEVLDSLEASAPKKKVAKKVPPTKASKKMETEDSSESSDHETDEEEEEEIKPKKKSGSKVNSEGPKKRKRIEKEAKITSKKRAKPVEKAAKDSSDAEDSGNDSEDSRSQSSAEKPVKKKEVSTPAYGKRVEHLKSVIKSCGMSVPPVIYKKVKQVPEDKREAHLIKELEEILSKEGLSSSPSEKEIKEVKKKKERAKELEGIDTSNIVSSSRRRSATSYLPPPKPKIPVESGSEDGDDSSDNDNDDDDDDDEEVENDEEDGRENDGDDGGESEEPNAESGEDSD